MTKGNTVAFAMKFTGEKIRTLAEQINKGNMRILDSINLPSHIHTMRYMEDTTQEVREVTCIDFGCPVQLSVRFFK